MDTRQPYIYVKPIHREHYRHGRFERQERIQHLVRRTPARFLWWKYWYEEILDTEIVPSYAWIAQGAFGDTCGWVSKFKDFINNPCNPNSPSVC